MVAVGVDSGASPSVVVRVEVGAVVVVVVVVAVGVTGWAAVGVASAFART
ncbi:MAG: hypothetical protein GY772_21715 [bacterium]|nr:hypothetical protein [bacterium]